MAGLEEKEEVKAHFSLSKLKMVSFWMSLYSVCFWERY